jgi:hypothetical protein
VVPWAGHIGLSINTVTIPSMAPAKPLDRFDRAHRVV